MNKLLKHIILLTTIALGLASATASDEGYQFLNVTPSSHVYALGGMNVSLVDDDIAMVYQNPAMLGGEMHLQSSVNYMRYLGGSNFMGAVMGFRLHERGAFALALQYYGYGKMDHTDVTGNVLGSFSPSDITFALSYSHDVTDRLRGGITVKGVSSNYEAYKAFAIATDLGLNYYNPESDLSLSLVLTNMGGQVTKFNDNSVSLPWDVRLGYSQTLSEMPLRISITAHDLTRWKMPYYKKPSQNIENANFEWDESFSSSLFRHLTFGVDYVASSNFYLALGYSYKTRTNMSTYSRNFLSGFSAGIGFRAKSLGVGMALAQPHVGGTTFMLNINCNIADFLD